MSDIISTKKLTLAQESKMAITVDMNTHGTILPSCYGYVYQMNTIDEECRKKGLMHPKSLYDSSYNRVMVRIIDVICSLNAMKSNSDLIPVVREKFRDMLYAVADHFEACSSILVIANKVKKISPKAIIDRNDDRRDLLAVVNAMKHRTSELVVFSRECHYTRTHGIFVKSVDADGSIVPYEEVHKPWLGLRTGWSFNRILKLIVYRLYSVGEIVATELDRVGMTFKAPDVSHQLHDVTIAAVKEVASMPDFFFPDEVKMKNVVFGLNESSLTLDLQHKSDIIQMTGSSYVNILLENVHEKETYGMPYWNAKMGR